MLAITRAENGVMVTIEPRIEAAMDNIAQIRLEVGNHLHGINPESRGMLGAPNWKGVLASLDGFLQSNSAIIGTLTPPQLDVFAQAIIQGIHLVDGAVNRPPVVNPNA